MLQVQMHRKRSDGEHRQTTIHLSMALSDCLSSLERFWYPIQHHKTQQFIYHKSLLTVHFAPCYCRPYHTSIMKKRSIIFLLPISVTSAFCPAGLLRRTPRDSAHSHASAAVSNQESVDSSSSLFEVVPESYNDPKPPGDDSTNSNNDVIVMSQALPFLPCPPVLRDNNFAGNVGFDPFGLAPTTELLWHYREAEIKHARLAMLVRL
jgi:Chlorophyll A-B binding protein